MKKITTIIAVIFCLSASAQVDTVKAAIQIVPVIVNTMTHDTAYQLTWSAFGVGRDTSLGCNTYVVLHSRTGSQVQSLNVAIPKQVVAAWTTDSVMDNYILTFLGLKKR